MKHILVAISGGIAAYKMPETIRLLQQCGYEVRVVMTQAAGAFVTPMALEAVSGNAPHQSLWNESSMLHIELARWADLILVAPATANVIAKLATGIADDLLTTSCVASEAPLLIAPAMNRIMWQHEATQANIKTLQARGAMICGPATGVQACGDVGPGRMLEPQQLVDHIKETCWQNKPILQGVRLLVTAGPTREPIDTIRYISNRSTGQMGYALAAAAHELGADVTLITGPTSLVPPPVSVIHVDTAQAMYEAVMLDIARYDVFVSAAAVADYTPKLVSTSKVKKQAGDWVLTLQRTRDILSAVTELPERPFCVGFAAEDDNLIAAATQKLRRKRLDMIVANMISDGFAQADNQVAVLTADGQRLDFVRQTKASLSYQLLHFLHECRQAMV